MAETEPSNSDRRPLVYFNVGCLGSIPIGLGEAMADEFGLVYHSGRQVWEKAVEARRQAGLPEPERVKKTRPTMAKLARVNLDNGKDVALGGFFNTPNTRRGYPLELAKAAKATTIALSYKTSLDIAIDRIRQMVRTDSLNKPLSQWGTSPFAVPYEDLRVIIRPRPEEDIDHVFWLSGEGSTPDTIGLIYDRLDDLGLVE